MAVCHLLLILYVLQVHVRVGSGDEQSRLPRVGDIESPLKRMAFGSCNDQAHDQPLWSNILQHDPQLWLWMGDNIYADIQPNRSLTTPPRKLFEPASSSVLRARYKAQEEVEGYKQLRSQVPIVGIWDDHDFGINDGHREYFNREASQQIFLDFMGEPSDSPRRKQKGIYTSYTIGQGETSVKFILLDNRYNRDPYGTENGDFLGEQQWQWLEKELKNSAAAFNIIVSGIQILPTDRFFPAECWHRFPAQRERLLNTIMQANVKGVILLSGDVHFAEINQVLCGDQSCPITEITSSGMTHSWLEFHFPKIKFFPALLFTYANILLPWEFRPTHDSYYGNLNWGQIDFDWSNSQHPVATVRVFGKDDKEKLVYQVKSLHVGSTSGATDALSCRAPRQISGWQRKVYQIVFMTILCAFVLSVVFNVVVLLWFATAIVRKGYAVMMRGVQRNHKPKLD